MLNWNEDEEEIGKVIVAVVYDMLDRSMIVELNVKISTISLIKTIMYIGSKVSGMTWIDFRYEKLPMFFFICGIMGNNEDHCKNPFPPTMESKE